MFLTNGISLRELGGYFVNSFGSTYSPNACVTVETKAPFKGYLYEYGVGSVVPTHADNGKRFSAFFWLLDGSDSFVAIGFGDAQNEKLEDDINILLVNVYDKSYSAEWHDGNDAYILYDQPLVDKLGSLNDGDEVCVHIGV